ncbi:MAG TPA: hypothetical protein VNZ57_15030 [Longimicrobiales bacterium]|nr:hypothetical protein [Longimicrobiales bacterium]
MARLQGEIEYSKKHYHDLRQRMAAHLQPYTTDPKVPEHLLAHALEFGVEHTVDTLTRDPAKFALVYPTPASIAASRPRTEELLDRLVEAEQSLTGFVVQREDALDQKQPGRERVMVHEGREFTFNAKTGEWRYLDNPDMVFTYTPTRVENTAAPTFTPDDDPTPTPRPQRPMRR